MHLRDGELEHGVALFFEAAATGERWSDALAAIAHGAGALGTNLISVAGGHGSVVCSPSLEEYMDDVVRSGWLEVNPYLRRGIQLTASGRKGLITSEDMLTAEEASRDPYINEHRLPGGLGPEAGIMLHASRDHIVPISLVRRRGDDPFSTAETRLLNRVMARLQQGARLAVLAGLSSARSLADTLGSPGRKIALLGAGGRILHASPGLEACLPEGLVLSAGGLSARSGPAQARLAQAVHTAVARDRPILDRTPARVTVPRPGRLPLAVDVVPIVGAGQDVFMLARAAIIIHDPDRRRQSNGGLAALEAMGLTRAEARLAAMVGGGADLASIAAAEGLSIATIRDRLKAVFQKTGTGRQAELALLVASLDP